MITKGRVVCTMIRDSASRNWNWNWKGSLVVEGKGERRKDWKDNCSMRHTDVEQWPFAPPFRPRHRHLSSDWEEANHLRSELVRQRG